MIPLQPFWPRWAYGMPNGNHNHYRRRCVNRRIDSILYWTLVSILSINPPPAMEIVAGLSTCADAMPIASVPTRSGLGSTTVTKSESITSPTHWAWEGGCG